MTDQTPAPGSVTWRPPEDLLKRLDERRLAHPDKLSRNEWLNRMVTYVLDNIDYDPSGVRKQHVYVNKDGGAPQ